MESMCERYGQKARQPEAHRQTAQTAPHPIRTRQQASVISAI
jgi:hypothetical protein